MEYILIFITAIFVNNIVLSQFLGICPFLGVSKKVETATGMGAAVAFVLTIATIVTYLIQKFVLDAFGLEYLQTIAFILVIAALVQMVEIILKKVSPALYQALGVFLPLITTNCCILGVAILVIQKDFDLLTGVVYAFSTALGFALAMVLFAGTASRGVSRAPRYSGPETRCQRPSGYGALTLFRRPSQAVPLDGWFVTAAEGCGPRLPRPTTPARKRPHACTRAGLGWPGFARRYSRDLG